MHVSILARGTDIPVRPGRTRMSGQREEKATRAKAKRKGFILSAEFLFVLPILIILVLAMTEYAFLLTGETRLSLASREGAKAAALGGNNGDVLKAINFVLGDQVSALLQYEVTYPQGTSNTGDPVTVEVTVPGSALAPNFLRIIGFNLAKVTLKAQTTTIIL